MNKTAQALETLVKHAISQKAIQGAAMKRIGKMTEEIAYQGPKAHKKWAIKTEEQLHRIGQPELARLGRSYETKAIHRYMESKPVKQELLQKALEGISKN